MNDDLIHESVRIVLLNEKNEILLMKVEDPSTRSVDGTYHGPCWFLIGGEIEPGEKLESTVYREIREETGIKESEISLISEIWFGEFPLIFSGKSRLMKQRFFLARTPRQELDLSGLTDKEKKVVQSIEWFSLSRMRDSQEVIYPVGLDSYLEPILSGCIPVKPQRIILDRKPDRKS